MQVSKNGWNKVSVRISLPCWYAKHYRLYPINITRGQNDLIPCALVPCATVTFVDGQSETEVSLYLQVSVISHDPSTPPSCASFT